MSARSSFDNNKDVGCTNSKAELFLQVMNREAKRLEKEIKEVLDEMGTDSEAKNRLLTGK